MKIFICICVTIIANSCSMPRNYQGYVYSSYKKPIQNVKVCEKNTSNCTTTDINGFFVLKKDKQSITDLIIFLDEKPLDTLKTVWSQHGEKLNYSFMEGKNDTLFINRK